MAVYTVVKTVGTTSRQYSTLQNWHDGAPTDLTTAEKSAATTFLTGTFTAGMSLTFVGSGATGKLLETDSTGPGSGTYLVYGITAGNPAASDVVTGTGGSPPTCVLTSGTADNVGVIWQGQCYNDSEFTSAANQLTVSGSTSSSTCYKELTTATGQSFRDNANVQTNALKYNVSNGVGVKTTNAYAITIDVNEGYFRMSNLQALSEGFGYAAVRLVGTNCTAKNCIIEKSAGISGTSYGVLNVDSADSSIINTVVSYLNNMGASTRLINCENHGPITFTNCTVVVASDKTLTGIGIRGTYCNLVITNCAVFGITTPASGTGSITLSTCYTDATLAGWTTVTYDTSTGSGFQGTTAAASDWRIKSTSALKDAGTTDSSASPDIAGTTRPQGSAYDVGVWELVAAGGSFPIGARSHRYPAIARH